MNKENINVLDILEDYNIDYTLKKSEAVFLCPFHADKKPSMWFNIDKKAYHCFSCSERGDIFSFMMKLEKKSFKEIIAKLETKYGISNSFNYQNKYDSLKQKLDKRKEAISDNTRNVTGTESIDYYRDKLNELYDKMKDTAWDSEERLKYYEFSNTYEELCNEIEKEL